MFQPGDRVVLKAHYSDTPGVDHYDRDLALGPRAKEAVGTVVRDDQHGSVTVTWDDPSLFGSDVRDPNSNGWSTGWFNPAPLPPVDTSTIDAVERYLNAP